MDPLHLKIVGDICFGSDLKDRDPLYSFEKIGDHLEADILAGNLECVLVPDRTAIDEEEFPKALYAYENCADALKANGFDIVWLANNHILDLGEEPMLATRDIVEKRGVATVGVGRDPADARQLKVIEKGGLKVGFLAYAEDCPQLARRRTPGPAYNRLSEMEEDIAQAKKVVDILVVAIHADVEFVDFPSLERWKYSHKLAALGADILIEGHPHVTQGIEIYQGALIAYSMGNFIFRLGEYQSGGSSWTAQSFILDVEISDKGVLSHSITPFALDKEDRPIPLEGDTRDAFLARHEALSADLSDVEKMEAHNLETVKRYLEININWLRSAYEDGGIDRVLEKFLPRLYMRENRFWAKEAARLAKNSLPEWESR